MSTATGLRRISVRLILLGGLLAGTLDGIAACLQYFIMTGKDPTNVFIYIASGVFGKEAFGGGVPMALWGALFHYCIATIWSSAIFLSSRYVRAWISNQYVRAIALGIVIWMIMNLVVLPLSNVPPITIRFDRALLAAAILVVCVALPIDLLVGRHLPRTTPVH